jgi:alpha-galactosidase
MAKITLIGAGSTGFSKRFISDILTRPALAEKGTLSLMDINQEYLDVTTALARKMVKQLGVSTKIESTTDRRRALEGSDYVISVILLHGLEARMVEHKIQRKYGVDQAVGCTTGPGGVFHALRYIPVMLDICRDMEELCPDAWFLHYANPTTTVPWAMNIASPIKSIGLCHSVQGTAMELARYIGAPFEETGHWVAGVNHQAWFLRFERNGEDAYPLLREKMEDPAIYRQDMVRWEMMRYFGHFLTESSYHNSEYVPYFRRTPEMIERFAPKVGTWEDLLISSEGSAEKRREELRVEAYGDGPVTVNRSEEYCIEIINAMETNVPIRFNGNVLNSGLITNLPPGCCVEVPCLVDSMGIHPCFVGDLPPQCASLNRNRLAGDELTVKGSLEADRKAIEQAIGLDPLTASVCTLDQIHNMVEELFEADAEHLPQFQ